MNFQHSRNFTAKPVFRTLWSGTTFYGQIITLVNKGATVREVQTLECDLFSLCSFQFQAVRRRFRSMAPKSGHKQWRNCWILDLVWSIHHCTSSATSSQLILAIMTSQFWPHQSIIAAFKSFKFDFWNYQTQKSLKRIELDKKSHPSDFNV